MDTTMLIAEVAQRSGFPAATLRYYEGLGLLPAPGRTGSGYRAYDESVLARLAFIARAKALGCSLEEIADLMPDWDGGRCAPVQDQLRELAATKLGEARTRVADLLSFTADLQRILATLGAHTPDGPCDADCGCVAAASSALAPPTADPPAAAPSAAADIACSLDSGELPGRLRDWEDLLAHVTDRASIEGGVRLELDPATPIDELGRLVAAEQSCCAFFAFAITVDERGIGLEVRAPAAAGPVVDSLFGAIR
jgi:DNA-binding transcriptional MerR regulator